MNKYELDVYHLLEDSKEFEKLNKKINRFNSFKILKVDQFETKAHNVIYIFPSNNMW